MTSAFPERPCFPIVPTPSVPVTLDVAVLAAPTVGRLCHLLLPGDLIGDLRGSLGSPAAAQVQPRSLLALCRGEDAVKGKQVDQFTRCDTK